MPNLRGASPVGRGVGGRRARQRCRTPGRVGEGARGSVRRGQARASRGEPDGSQRTREGGRRRPGPGRGGLGRFWAVWAGLGERERHAKARLNTCGLNKVIIK